MLISNYDDINCMGKKNIEIVGAKEGTIQMLRKAYSLEMSVFHYWFYIDQYVEGIGFLHSNFFSERANDELGHAKKIAFRLDQLGDVAPDDPGLWEKISGLGKLEPARYLTLKSALQKALEFERIAIGLYNDLTNNTQGKDNVTYHLALDILEDEAKDEQEIENILNKLEF